MRGEQKEIEGTRRGNGESFSPSNQKKEDKSKDISEAQRARTNVTIQDIRKYCSNGFGAEDPHTRDHDLANCVTAFSGLGLTTKPQSEPARGHRSIMASLRQMIKAQLKCAKCLCH